MCHVLIDFFFSYKIMVTPTKPDVKKLAKSIIEKRRRARINALIEKLKHLMVNEEEEERVSKLDKVELLELIVDYVKKLKRTGVCDGYKQCVNEVARIFDVLQMDNGEIVMSMLATKLCTIMKKP